MLHGGGPEPQLAYYRGARREAGPPAGALRLAGARVAVDAHNLTAFSVCDASGRTYHLKAASAGQRQHWADAIASAVRHAAAAAAHASPAAASPSPSRRPTGLAVPGPAAFQGRRSSSHSDAALPSPGGSSAGTPGSARRPPRAQRSWAASLFHHSSTSTEAEARGTSRTGSDAAAAAAQAAAAQQMPAVEAAEAYSASLPALQGPRGGAPIQALMAGLQSSLPLESIDEHYQRALLFVERHTAELSSEQLGVLEVGARVGFGGVRGAGWRGSTRDCLPCAGLPRPAMHDWWAAVGAPASLCTPAAPPLPRAPQGWKGIVSGQAPHSPGAVAAQCMLVMELTRVLPEWNNWL